MQLLVKLKMVLYGEIPYYNGVRVDAVQKKSSDTEIVCYYKDGDGAVQAGCLEMFRLEQASGNNPDPKFIMIWDWWGLEPIIPSIILISEPPRGIQL